MKLNIICLLRETQNNKFQYLQANYLFLYIIIIIRIYTARKDQAILKNNLKCK